MSNKMDTLDTLRTILIESINKLNEVRGDTLARRLGLPSDPDYEGRHTATEKGEERADKALKAPKGSPARLSAVRAARQNVPRFPKKNKK